jgi:hypothetical protein
LHFTRSLPRDFEAVYDIEYYTFFAMKRSGNPADAKTRLWRRFGSKIVIASPRRSRLFLACYGQIIPLLPSCCRPVSTA